LPFLRHIPLACEYHSAFHRESMSTSGVSASAADPSTARSEESLRGKRGIELWLDESASDTATPVKKTMTVAPQTPSASPATSPGRAAADQAADTAKPKPLNGLMESPQVSPSTSARPSAPPEGADSAVEDQLKLLKEKRRSRASGPPSTTSSLNERPASNEAVEPSIAEKHGVPPIPIGATKPGSGPGTRSRSGTGGGKPPLSGRRGVVNQTVHRSGRPSSEGAMSSRGAPPSLSGAEIVKKIKDLQSADWKTVSSALESLRAVLTGSASLNDEVRVVMRQNLHGLVTGTLAAMDSPRSALAKFATDMLGLVCQKLGTRHLQLDGPDADEEAAAAVGGSSNSLEHFVEPIVNKIIAKGGAASSRFLYDGAAIALKELVPATKPLKVLHALNGVTGIKTDKSKVLHADGLANSFDNLQPHSLRNKTDAIAKAVDTADHYVHDAHPDVREAGKKLCRSIASYCSESKENLRALVTKTIGAAQPQRAKETLAFCVAVSSSDTELMAKPPSAPSQPSTGRGSDAPTRSPQADPSLPPRSGRRAVNSSRENTSATSTPAGSPQEKPPRRRRSSKDGRDEVAAPAALVKKAESGTTTPPPQPLSASALASRTPGVSPINTNIAENQVCNDSMASIDESQLPGRREPTSPLISPSAAGSPRSLAPFSGNGSTASPRPSSMDATQTNNSLFQNQSFFTGTISRDMQHEHGEFSQGIFAAAEGSSADRLKALEGLTQLLRKRLMDEDVHKCPVANATCFALCDVTALRCADTSQKVQVAALQLVPTLFQVVQPAVIDSTSPRWVSCLSTALASSYPAVHSAAVAAMKALMQCSTEANLRNLCQTICMSCSTVRNVNTKVELLEALELILRRNHVILKRELGGGATSPLSTTQGRPGLTQLDLEFCTETGLRIWCSDPREEVRRVVGRYILAVVSYAWDGDEAKVLDNKRLDADNWALIKALIDRSREQSPTA